MLQIPVSASAPTAGQPLAAEDYAPLQQSSMPAAPQAGDLPPVEIERRLSYSPRSKSNQRKSRRLVLVTSLATSTLLLSAVAALMVFMSRGESPLATNGDEDLASSSLVEDSEQTPSVIFSKDDERLGPASTDRQRLEQITTANRQRQLSRDRAPTDRELMGESSSILQPYWNSCVDPARERLVLDSGIHLLEGIQGSAPNAGIDNFLITGGVILEPGAALEHFVSILSCPTLNVVHTLREEVSFTHTTCDVSPSGNYLLNEAFVGEPEDRRRMLRLHSFQNGMTKYIPFDRPLQAVQFVSDDIVLLQTKDRVLQLFDLQRGTGEQIHEFPGTQLTYWNVTPGKQFVLIYSGASPVSLRVVSLSDSRVRDHARKNLEMEREFVIHHAQLSPNGRYLHLGLHNPRASRKRLRIIDLETGETKRDIEDSELPESLTFSASLPVVTDDASWLFPSGQLVDSKTLAVTWRAETVFSEFRPYNHVWFVCADNRAATFQPRTGKPAAVQLLVADLP